MQPQRDLFAESPGYPGRPVYTPDFLDRDEETALLATVSALPVAEAKYRGFAARRRTMHFGPITFRTLRDTARPTPPTPGTP